jgi:hypothetical protein
MKKKVAIILGAVAIVGGLALALGAYAQNTNPPAHHEPAVSHSPIRTAMIRLREARAELESTKQDYGGHRVLAIKAIDTAIDEVRQAVQSEKNEKSEKK